MWSFLNLVDLKNRSGHGHSHGYSHGYMAMAMAMRGGVDVCENLFVIVKTLFYVFVVQFWSF